MFHLFAYLDAGTGSMILQALMGGFAGLLVLSKVAWNAILPRIRPGGVKEAAAD